MKPLFIHQVGKEPEKPANGFQEELTLTVTVKCTSAPHMSSHKSTFKYADTSCDVEVDGKEIGHVYGCLGGVIELVDERTHTSYWLKPDVLWAEFQKALATTPTHNNVIT